MWHTLPHSALVRLEERWMRGNFSGPRSMGSGLGVEGTPGVGRGWGSMWSAEESGDSVNNGSVTVARGGTERAASSRANENSS